MSEREQERGDEHQVVLLFDAIALPVTYGHSVQWHAAFAVSLNAA